MGWVGWGSRVYLSQSHPRLLARTYDREAIPSFQSTYPTEDFVVRAQVVNVDDGGQEDIPALDLLRPIRREGHQVDVG